MKLGERAVSYRSHVIPLYGRCLCLQFIELYNMNEHTLIDIRFSLKQRWM
jgi:hypothetical protein